MTQKNAPQNWEEYKAQLVEGFSEKQAETLGTLLQNVHESNTKDTNKFNTTLVEAATTGATGTGNISRYDTMFMPIVRRTMPALLANDLVGVQPQTTPQAMIRTLRMRYAETTNDTDGGTPVVTAGDEASGVNVYDKYSLLAKGGDYDEVDALDPYAQTLYLESNIGKDMNLEVLTQSETTKTRKLSATFTLEAQDDLSSLDGLDVESELSDSLGSEILRDLDRELIAKLRSLAGIVTNFDFAVVDGRYAGEKLAALSIAVDNLSAEIAMKTKRSGATWMVVSQKVFTGLKHASNGSFVPATTSGQPEIGTSLFVGTFAGNVRVYVDPYATGDSVLMGYKGNELDTGLIYAPYIPLQSAGLGQDTNTGDQKLMMRTRYALHAMTDTATSLGNASDFYARASVSNITLGFTN